MKSIVLLGAYPPPVGGNSVHVQRLHARLVSDGIDCNVVDVYGRAEEVAPAGVLRFTGGRVMALLKGLRAIRILRPQLLHIHVSAMRKFVLAWPLIALLLPRHCRTVLTIHSGSFARQSSWREGLESKILQWFDRIVVVGQEQRTALLAHGVSPFRIAVIPAYLAAPIDTNDVELLSMVQSDRQKGLHIIITSGYGIPLYGHDQVASAIDVLRQRGQACALYVCTYNTFDEAYLAAVSGLGEQLPEFRLFRNLTPQQFTCLLAQCDIYVRATDRDGDAVAIREAHGAGIRVVASDAVRRPHYCRLYRLGDIQDLASALLFELNSDERSEVTKESDSYQDIRAVYRELLDE